jgi:AraC-like DNA-binding protein
MNDGYNDNLTLDRIDVNGNYTKDNCRWITLFDQQSNKRNTIYIEHEGRKKTLKEWSVHTGISVSALYQRYNAGLPPKKILEQDIRTKIKLTMHNEERSIKEWSEKTGLTERLIRSRYEYGWDHERILTTPVQKEKRRR